MIKKTKVSQYGDYPREWEKTGILSAGTKIVVMCGGDVEYELILDDDAGIYHMKDSGYDYLTDDSFFIISDDESVFIIENEPYEIDTTNSEDKENNGLDSIDKKYFDGSWILIGHN